MASKLQQWLRVEKNQSVVTLSAINLIVFVSSSSAMWWVLLLLLQLLSIALLYLCYAVTRAPLFEAYEKPASKFWHSLSTQVRSVLLLVLLFMGYKYVLARLLISSFVSVRGYVLTFGKQQHNSNKDKRSKTEQQRQIDSDERKKPTPSSSLHTPVDSDNDSRSDRSTGVTPTTPGVTKRLFGR
jgi:hypothetical protein